MSVRANSSSSKTMKELPSSDQRMRFVLFPLSRKLLQCQYEFSSSKQGGGQESGQESETYLLSF